LPSSGSRVVVFDESGARGEVLQRGLALAGCDVVAVVQSPMELALGFDWSRVDMVVVGTDSPGRDVIEHLCVVSRDHPRPIVMFSGERDTEAIRAATRAGVTAYVVGDVRTADVRPVLDAAVAQFEEMQRLRAELADTRQELSDRKLVERAKGILMQRRGISEPEAYGALRTEAMARGEKLVVVARQVVEVAKLLG
jgi:response regulator NasT